MPAADHDVPCRTLGRTGERVSAIGLGGWHLGFSNLTDEESVRSAGWLLDETADGQVRLQPAPGAAGGVMPGQVG